MLKAVCAVCKERYWLQIYTVVAFLLVYIYVYIAVYKLYQIKTKPFLYHVLNCDFSKEDYFV